MHLAKDLFELPLVFATTMILLTSSLTSVYAMYHMKNFKFKKMKLWLGVTVVLGACFLDLKFMSLIIMSMNFIIHLQVVLLVRLFIH